MRSLVSPRLTLFKMATDTGVRSFALLIFDATEIASIRASWIKENCKFKIFFTWIDYRFQFSVADGIKILISLKSGDSRFTV